MKSKILFSKIKSEIISNLDSAKKEIKVAVAWLTDEDLIWKLTQKRGAGINVQIALSDSEENFKNNAKFKEFLRLKGQLYISTKVFLHHKFCIIDNKTILNGSYNWSYPAIKHEENIMVISIDNSIKEDRDLLQKFNVKFDYLCNRCSVLAADMNLLNTFTENSKNNAVILADLDEREIQLRQQFENDVRQSFEKAKAAKIPISQLVLERILAEGGGVESVKRILHDEISSGEMKSGFKKLEEHIPPRIDLSLEYIVSRPKYHDLFTSEEIEFCIKLIKKYGL